jgi:hypothetical protein
LDLAAAEQPIQRGGVRFVERGGTATHGFHLGQRLFHRRQLVDRLYPARDVRQFRGSPFRFRTALPSHAQAAAETRGAKTLKN